MDKPPREAGRVSREADALVERLRHLGAAKRLLVALDFDGTLAPLVADPATARITPAAFDAVLGLAATLNTRVAIVSGRSLDSLGAVASEVPDFILLVGSHGVEYRLDHPEDVPSLNSEESGQMRELIDEVTRSVAEFPDVWVETKPVGITVHTRQASSDIAEIALGRVRAAVGALDVELTERTGKDVLEYSLRDAHKGDAIRRLRAYTQANAVFYAGDDVTDEDAFAVLGQDDLGIKCGEGATRAEFRVSSIQELIEVLRLLAALRAR